MLSIFVTTPFAAQVNDQPIGRMITESRMSIPVVIVFAMVNATFEEIFLLGALVRGLRGFGLSIAIGLPLLVRVLYHLYQGPLGAIWILCFGLLFSITYVRRPVLWAPVFAHVLWDIVPFTTLGG